MTDGYDPDSSQALELLSQIAGRVHSYSDPDYAGMSPYMS